MLYSGYGSEFPTNITKNIDGFELYSKRGDFSGIPPELKNNIILENGFNILLESGGVILLENSI
jgi:hypothetical protein